MKKIRVPDRRDGWYEIHPSDAQALLDGQNANRPLREQKAVRFARHMTAGKWRPNGEPLILDEQDRLLDGQGRCRGCVISGKPFTSYVVHGIPRHYFTSLDTGQSRGGSDTIALLGGTSNYVLAAAVSWLALACEKGAPSSSRSAGKSISNDDIAAYYKKNREGVDAAIDALKGHFKTCPLSPSVLCYVYMQALKTDEKKATEWAFGVATGQNLTSQSPVLLLRNRMLALKGQAAALSQFEKLALAIKSWNAFYEARPLGVLKWSGRKGNPDSFPTFTVAF